jgi:hypothetical protein
MLGIAPLRSQRLDFLYDMKQFLGTTQAFLVHPEALNVVTMYFLVINE